ncbi:MAG: type II restriction enzyme [Candidatus Heimdallarchaeaceae archaeon]
MKSIPSQKSELLGNFFKKCLKEHNFQFSNKDLKKYASENNYPVGNIFDVTKLDHISKLPGEMKEKDYCLIHIGSGNHLFVKGIENGYHFFEKEVVNQKTKSISVKFSVLDGFDSSEANLLSQVFNRRVVYDFIYDDLSANPNIYLPTRSKTNFEFYIDDKKVRAENIQMETDLILENNGEITLFECKNNIRDEPDFAIYQLYYPFLKYYLEMKKGSKIRTINCCYISRNPKKNYKNTNRPKEIEMYLYTFSDPLKMNSIKLIKARKYYLVEQETLTA